MTDMRVSHPVLPKQPATRPRRNWLVLALTSLITAPVMVYLSALAIVAVAYDWTVDAAETAEMVNLILAGAVGGLVVGLVARLKGFALALPLILGALVGYGFHQFIWEGTALTWSDEATIFLIYTPVQAVVYFLSTWFQSHE